METGLASLVGTMDTGALDTEAPPVACHQRKLYDGDKAWIVSMPVAWHHTMQHADGLPLVDGVCQPADTLLRRKMAVLAEHQDPLPMTKGPGGT